MRSAFDAFLEGRMGEAAKSSQPLGFEVLAGSFFVSGIGVRPFVTPPARLAYSVKLEIDFSSLVA